MGNHRAKRTGTGDGGVLKEYVWGTFHFALFGVIRCICLKLASNSKAVLMSCGIEVNSKVHLGVL